MPYLKSKGNPSSKVWVVVEAPYSTDKDKGYLWSGGYGYVFEKMLANVGIRDYYVIARAPDTDDKFAMAIVENELNHYRPPIVLVIENTGKHFCSELVKSEFSTRAAKEDESEIAKYAGSLLRSPLLTYPHWIIPTYGPDTVVKDWKIRDIVTSLDLGKAASELAYYETHNNTLEPYLARTLEYEINDFGQLLGYLDRFEQRDLIANDIETVYPKVNKNRPSAYEWHPGIHVSVSFAESPTFGIAFELFRQDADETRILWRKIQRLFDKVPQLGQNFFTFDCPRWEMLGFRIDKTKVVDTLIRQHILFPELPKDLAFMTRQYTREPYYKDEGHGWNMKNMTKLKRYNALDTTVDFEVYLGQEKEFDERPHLR
jgi:hypothetical protein